MQEDLDSVTEWLLRASSEIPREYFQLPVADAEEPEYRERVYCYELYHRWRCHWPGDFPFSLGGEVDKTGHPIIRGNPKPDFLVHVPGKMTNLLVVEVKPRNRDIGRMAEDLKKLVAFRRQPVNYFAAYFLVYGLTLSEWPTLRERLLLAARGDVEFDRMLISCFVHEAPGERAKAVAWQ
ncbi:MAG: hypothetical protein HYY78_23775 [Betaproteobacteria bacterium]|nr:hypothetical protein [Betaproteobacteria bacterium]